MIDRPSKTRTTGLQAAHLSLACQLGAWREQFSREEYEALVDIHSRFVDRERERLELRALPGNAHPSRNGARAAVSAGERGSANPSVTQRVAA